jgi:ankyrin repeat protein
MTFRFRSGMVVAAGLLIATFARAQGATDGAALIETIRGADAASAMAMIDRGVDANAAQGDGTTALHWAVYRNDTTLAKALLAHGARADARNNFGVTPLTEAVKVANLELVRALLKAGADTESTNHDDQTALMVAARVGSTPVVDELLRHGAKVNAREKWRGQTALMWAAAGDQPEVVELLIRRGADVHARAVINDWGSQVTSEPRAQYRPTGGMTALLYASRTGCQRCVVAMLKAKAGIDVPTPDGITPLMVALDNQHFALARHLLERGANPNLADWWGRTALYIATDAHTITSRTGPVGDDEDRASALDLMRRLLDAGVDPNPQLNFHRPGRGGNSGRFTDDLLTVGATPLLRAALSFDDEAIRLLLERGALVDLPNGMGVTPLMAAAGFGTSIRDIRGSHTAPDAEARSIATMKILIAAGADVNARATDTSGRTARIARPSAVTDRQGQTAIYGAINWGWVSVVRFLLDNGARLDIADAKGKTPLDAIRGNAGGRDHKTVPEIVTMIESAAKKS